MKFITFKRGDNRLRVGLLESEKMVIDLTGTGEKYPYFSDMQSLINAGNVAIEKINEIITSGENIERVEIDTITILAPIPRPNRNIYCVGLNYVEHNEEFGGTKSELPEAPIIFTKVPTTVIGCEEEIYSHPGVTDEIDYEAELGVIIGKSGSNISQEEAMDFVFGYTIINDVTARDLQRIHKQWFIGKSLDTFCPMGPYLAHYSSIKEPHNLNISCKVNGELRQSSNTRNLIFDIPTIISTISKGHTLEAGDIIATGTCAGVGMAFNPPRFLQKGDVVEVEIEKLGSLRNVVS